VHHLVARNTVDERIMQVLAMKGGAQQALLDAVLVDAVNEMKERVGV